MGNGEAQKETTEGFRKGYDGIKWASKTTQKTKPESKQLDIEDYIKEVAKSNE